MLPTFALWLHALALLHPFYVSVTEINHNPEAASLEISIKMFADDLEDALQQRFGETMHLGLEDEHPDADVYLALYLKDELQIEVDGQPVTFAYLGKDANLEAAWCFLEIKNVPAPREVQVRNTLLTELFETQKNMVHVRIGGETQSMLLQRRKLSDTASFR
jgi:hypothetical protein